MGGVEKQLLCRTHTYAYAYTRRLYIHVHATGDLPECDSLLVRRTTRQSGDNNNKGC